MSVPYYADELVTLYHGDCREITAWLGADVLVTDPPYGRGWRQGRTHKDRGWADDSHPGIAGDQDTTMRDFMLLRWSRQGVVFGDLMLPPPAGTRQVLIFKKSVLMGTKGTFAGFRRDVEAIYLVGPWVGGLGGESSVITSQALGNQVQSKYEHPHAKPVDVMERLITACPIGSIADPFAGSGSTLVAARNLGRKAIGVEIEERYCEIAARRLSQAVMIA